MKVFYNKQQQVDSLVSDSPSAGKPRLVVQSWKQRTSVQIMPVRPLSHDELGLAHDAAYVKGVLGCRIKNGFGNKSKDIARSLRWTTGSFVSAAIDALQTGGPTFSPTSGFHHAKYNRADGFCTFAGLTIAAIILHRQHDARSIGILDLDSHAGDGTEQTIRKTDSEGFVRHYSLGYDKIDLYNNESWLNELPKLMRTIYHDCDILFYQAGVDCHIDDPYVDSGQFTTDQIRRREESVFATCREMSLPVVTNLAGGYQSPVEKVVALHDLTAIAYAQAYGLPPTVH